MDNFNFGSYDPANTDAVFDDASYVNPASEQETRKQLSYPFYELKQYINKVTNIDTSSNVVQLKVSPTTMHYSLDNGATWTAVTVQSSGQAVNGAPQGGTTGQVLKKHSNTDFDMEWGEVETYTAGAGISISGSAIAHTNSTTARTSQAVYPITVDTEGHITGTGNAVTTMTPSSHVHGKITNAGDITTSVAIASGDRLVINDESASQLNNSSITFGSSTSTYLSNKGTWGTPATQGIDPTNLLVTKTSSSSWTATQDCWGVFYIPNDYSQYGPGITIDGNADFLFFKVPSGLQVEYKTTFFVKKGQVIATNVRTTFKAYGLKI